MRTAGDRIGSFDDVIVGGGIVGLSTAYHLLKNEGRSVLVIDAGPVGSGASGLGAGMVVAQRFQPLDIALVTRSLSILNDLGQLTGGMVGINRTGRLALVAEQDAAAYRDYIAMQCEAGVDARELDPAQIAALFPETKIRVDDVALAGYSPDDGTVHPPTIVTALTSLVKKSGGYVLEGAQVRALEPRGSGGGTVVLASGERVVGAQLVVAAGAWTSQLLATADLPLPQYMFRTEASVAILTDPRAGFLPAVVDGVIGAIHVPRNPGIYHSSTADSEWRMLRPETLKDWRAGSARGRQMSVETMESTKAVLEHRFPDLGEISIEPGWTGITEDSADHDPLLGDYPGVPGLYVACGFGGYGVMRGLAMGESMAGLADGSGRGVDVGQCALSRMDLSAPLSHEPAAHNPLSAFTDWDRELTD